LLQSTVDIDRLMVNDGWPLWLRRPELKREEVADEQAVGKVVEKCKNGTPLDASDVDKLRDTVIALQKKVPSAVPGRDNQRSRAMEYVNLLDGATRIFAEQTYAERLIKDVTEHKAETVGELLGFMRYHRLLFAPTGKSPEAAQRYESMYQLLREQKEKLGINNTPAGGLAAAAVTPEPAKPASAAGRWLHMNREPMELNADGTIIKGRGRGKWRQEGKLLVLSWPTPGAPGGAWIDRVTLSADGNRYEGKNQHGDHIYGKRPRR
jgi:hypothetical protein